MSSCTGNALVMTKCPLHKEPPTTKLHYTPLRLWRTFSRRLLPDRFQEITDRVYVFDCCLSTREVREEEYKAYMETAVSNLQKQHPGASFMVFNFKEGDDPSLLSDILSQHDMTVVDYPRHYEGYPILPLEMIHYFLRSSDSWLSLEGQRNVILMHCERGGWPALAFMLAGLLLYTGKQAGELKTLERVLRQAPKDLATPLSLMDPRPSQLRYLGYISGTSDWPPSHAPLLIQSLLLMNLPLFDAAKGCRPVVHVYGQDPSMKTSSARPRLLCSSLMSEDGAHYYSKEECLLVKINLNCRVQGDVFLECIHLGDDLVSEDKVFKVMFHTAFVQSYTTLLAASEVDVLCNANCKIPNDFKVQVLFSNPEEVQLRIAKEMASLESGHESETEFFEAEEFEISVSQDHNRHHHNHHHRMSKEGSYILYDDDEANVGDESLMEVNGSKVQGTRHTAFSVSCSEEEYDSNQADAESDFGTSAVENVPERSQEAGSEIASSQITYEASKDGVAVEETTKGGSPLEATMELNNATRSFLLLEENQEDSSNASPLDARLEPNIAVEGSDFAANTVSKSIVVKEGSEHGSNIVVPESTCDTIISSELELDFAAKNFLAVGETRESSSRTGSYSNFEVEQGGCSEISSSEVESENCAMSKSFISIEGSEDSSEATSSPTGTEFLAAQATSSELNNASKHIVVVVGDSKEHDVKVQVQPKAPDGGSKGAHKKIKNKKKPRLADAVAKVTMQKRVVSMWVPRDKQPTPDDTKQKAPAYKWVPKESVSTSEEASKQTN